MSTHERNLIEIQVLRILRWVFFRTWGILYLAYGIMVWFSMAGPLVLWHADPFDKAAAPVLLGLGDVATVLWLACWGFILILRFLNGWDKTKPENMDIGIHILHEVEMQEEPILSPRNPCRDWV